MVTAEASRWQVRNAEFGMRNAELDKYRILITTRKDTDKHGNPRKNIKIDTSVN